MRQGYISTFEVAKRLGITPESVRQKCRADRIPGAYQIDDGGRWHIPEVWVDDVRAAVKPHRRRPKTG